MYKLILFITLFLIISCQGGSSAPSTVTATKSATTVAQPQPLYLMEASRSDNLPDCPSHSGTQILGGYDKAGTGVLTTSEITFNTYICDGSNGTEGSSCSVKQTNTGAEISCTDGTYAYAYNGTSSSCSVAGNAEGATITCSDGTTSKIANGTNCTVEQVSGGANIVCGSDSVFVANGQNTSNPVTMVQFCPGYTTTYPSTFPEFGICISGNIYAVYWDSSNSWLSEVVPGQYLSTSTSAPCTFTVLSNCQIQN